MQQVFCNSVVNISHINSLFMSFQKDWHYLKEKKDVKHKTLQFVTSSEIIG